MPTPRFSKPLGMEGIPNETNPLVDQSERKENVSDRRKMFEGGSVPTMPEEFSKFIQPVKKIPAIFFSRDLIQ